MIIKAHKRFYMRWMPFIKPPTLMLGNQVVERGYETPFPPYTTLDPDGGDWQVDLSSVSSLKPFQTVINIGTIEHIWDVHGAWCNATWMVNVGGHFLSVSPCSGYQYHGVHITEPKYIVEFLQANGFAMIDTWFTNRTDEVKTPKGDGNFWVVAKKIKNVVDQPKPQQIFKDGKPVR